MCGILAMLRDREPVDRQHIEMALASMRGRGPDGQGIFESDDARVVLAHRRLAILDLEGGQQPIASEDHQIVAIVNGEFYGFEALRQQLQARGHHFRTKSDSEILVHLYQERGLDALQELHGEFAFVLWDNLKKRLFAARDRFGVKPLLYGRQGDTIYLASNAKALFSAGYKRQWDQASFFQAMSLQYPLPGRTLFEGVKSLEPGSWLLVQAGQITCRQYWEQHYPQIGAQRALRGESTEVAEFGDLLRQAVCKRLRADVALACQLSGGIDSSAVAALAARELGTKLPCFTVGFQHAQYDERALAGEVVQAIGGEHHVVEVSTQDLADNFVAAVHAGEGLCINGHISAKYLLLQKIRASGYKIALTGEGADEVLLGYAHLRQDLLGHNQELHSTNRASMGVMLPAGQELCTSGIAKALGFVPTWLRAKAALGYRLHEFLNPCWLADFASQDPYQQLAGGVDLSLLHNRERPLQSAYLWSKLALEGYILHTLGDGMEMAHGVEGRLPFLDTQLFAWLQDAPMSLKIRDGKEKWILREAMRGMIPESVRTREKHPFLAPPHFRNASATGHASSHLGQLLGDMLSSGALSRLAFFDIKAIRRRLDQTHTAELTLDPALYMIASACVLQQTLELSEAT